MTPEEDSTPTKKSAPDSEQVDALIKENQSYKTLFLMQNENYFRAEILESLMMVANQIATVTNQITILNSTIDTRLEDLIKVLIGKAKPKKK